MAGDKSTKRSQLDADHVTGVLRAVGSPTVSPTFSSSIAAVSHEDSHKFIKTAFSIEEVQFSTFTAIRNLVAYDWVAAGFILRIRLLR
jgi:hypothetical protein